MRATPEKLVRHSQVNSGIQVPTNKPPQKKRAKRAVQKEQDAPRERLLAAAERQFADYGYNGVSVRDLVKAAGVNIGTLIYHFGTKENLFHAVFKRLAEPVKEERHRRLAAVYSDMKGRKVPDINEILKATLEPTFQDKRSNDVHRRLAGRTATDPTPEVRRVLNQIYPIEKLSSPPALRACCPHLSDQEFYWRYFAYLGAVQYVLADVGRIQAIAGKSFDTSDPEVALEHVIPFLAAGFLAPPKRKATAKRRASRK
jgi:AcrR family transcriptional regulator